MLLVVLVDFSEERVEVVNVTPARLSVLRDDVDHDLLVSSTSRTTSAMKLRRSVILTL